MIAYYCDDCKGIVFEYIKKSTRSTYHNAFTDNAIDYYHTYDDNYYCPECSKKLKEIKICNIYKFHEYRINITDPVIKMLYLNEDTLMELML